MLRHNMRFRLLFGLPLFFLLVVFLTSAEECHGLGLPSLVWKGEGGMVRLPVLADVDGDGKVEILAAAAASEGSGKKGGVSCYEMGSEPFRRWSFPPGGDDFPVWGCPAVGDLNGDSIPEVVLGTTDGRLVCLSRGRVLWEAKNLGEIYSSPALGDVNGDGKMEVVVGSRGGHLFCFEGVRGSLLWQFQCKGDVDSSPALGDVNGDGKMEVVVGSDDGFVYCFSGTDGGVLWQRKTGWWVTASPIIADLRGDGAREVVVGSNDGSLYCLDGKTGEVLWSYKTPLPIVGEASAADFGGEGRKQVFFASDAVYCLDSSGQLLWKFDNGEYFSGTPVLLEEDGRGYVLVSGENLYCLDGVSGELLWKRSVSEKGLFDFSVGRDAEGNVLLAICGGEGELSLLRFPGRGGGIAIDWGKFRGDAANTGFVPSGAGKGGGP